MKRAKSSTIITKVLDCRKEFAARPLHTIAGDEAARSRMQAEFPMHWEFHPRRRYGKTAREWAADPNKENNRLRRKFENSARSHRKNGKLVHG